MSSCFLEITVWQWEALWIWGFFKMLTMCCCVSGQSSAGSCVEGKRHKNVFIWDTASGPGRSSHYTEILLHVLVISWDLLILKLFDSILYIIWWSSMQCKSKIYGLNTESLQFVILKRWHLWFSWALCLCLTWPMLTTITPCLLTGSLDGFGPWNQSWLRLEAALTWHEHEHTVSNMWLSCGVFL